MSGKGGISSKRLTITAERSPRHRVRQQHIGEDPGPLIQPIQRAHPTPAARVAKAGRAGQRLRPPRSKVAMGRSHQGLNARSANSDRASCSSPASRRQVRHPDTRLLLPQHVGIAAARSSSPSCCDSGKALGPRPVTSRHGLASSPHGAEASAVLPLPLLPTKANSPAG